MTAVTAGNTTSCWSLKEALADPEHEEHEDLLDWLGLDCAADFDPAQFSLDEVNARLSQLL